jgi:hypothetical protein
MARLLAVVLIALSLAAGTAAPAGAQLGRALIGAGVGVAGGSVITMSAIVARARFQREYIDSVEDLIHWQTIPMIAAPAAGTLFGFAGGSALKGSVVGSVSGMAAGAAAGAGLGWLLSREQEAPWAGGVIGAGVGMTIGGLAGGLVAWARDDNPGLEFPDRLRLTLSIPVR